MSLERFIALAAVSAAVLLVPGSRAVRADPPSGAYTLPFDGVDSIITPRLINTVEHQCEDVPGVGTVCVDLTNDLRVVADSKGKLTGSGALQFSATTDGRLAIRGTMNGTVTGAIKGKARDSALNLKFKLVGSVNVGLGDLPTKVTGSLKGSVSKSGLFIGTQTVSVKIKGLAAEKVSVAVTEQLAGPFNWDLMLDVVAIGDGDLGGAGHALLADGSSYGFAIRGKYNPKKDESTLTLKPNEDARGASIKIKNLATTGSSITGAQVMYKLVGQAAKKQFGQ